mgnify:CR=1 FL=1
MPQVRGLADERDAWRRQFPRRETAHRHDAARAVDPHRAQHRMGPTLDDGGEQAAAGDAFAFFISGAKVRNPAAALALSAAI